MSCYDFDFNDFMLISLCIATDWLLIADLIDIVGLIFSILILEFDYWSIDCSCDCSLSVAYLCISRTSSSFTIDCLSSSSSTYCMLLALKST